MVTMNPREEQAREEWQLAPLWRKPEKHFVRVMGWLQTALGRKKRKGKPIRYFTLCGQEAIDIRLLERHGIVVKTSRGYPDVGFCEEDAGIYGAIINSLKSVGKPLFGKFEDIANQSNFTDWFRYDVVNLDFSCRVFRGSQDPFVGVWGAIQRVLEAQAEQDTGFDLFLTFNASRGTGDKASVSQLRNLLEQNLQDERRKQVFQRQAGTTTLSKLVNTDFTRFLLYAVPKLLSMLAIENGFSVGISDSYYYKRRPRDRPPYHIVKFIFTLERRHKRPRRVKDLPQAVADYNKVALQAIISKKINVDLELQARPKLKQGLSQHVKLLLK